MINIYQKKINDTELKEVEDFKPGCWINVFDTSKDEILEIEKNFKVDANILKDVLDPYEAPRVEVDENIVYIFVRTPQINNEKITTEPFLIVVGGDFIMTICREKVDILKNFFENKVNFTTTQKSQSVIKIMSEITKSYNNFITNISKDVRGTSKKFSKINEKIIINFVEIEEVLNDFLLVLTHTKSVLQNILTGKIIKLYEADKELTEDLVLNTDQLLEICKSNLINIVNIREAYSTIITNELNKVIKVFTSFTVILTIPTIIASLYGMNLLLPLSNNPYAFWIIISFISVIVFFVIYIFNRNDWL